MAKVDAMEVFLRVVQAGSLSAAAKRLNVPLPTVSRRIATLEAHLKTRLLNRSSRRLSLTEAGRLYFEASKRILEQVEEAERAIMGVYQDPKGLLTVTAPIVIGRVHVIPIIAGFLAEYPDIDVKLILSDRLLDLLESNVDVGLRIGELEDSSLIASRIGTARRVTCASPAYLDRQGRPQTPKDVSRHDCITFDNLASPESWRFTSPKGELPVPVRSRLTVTTAEAALEAAVAGAGLTRLLSYQVTEAVLAGTLELLLVDYELPAWPISLVYIGQPLLPTKLRAFLDYITPRLRDRLRDEQSTLGSRR